MPDPYRALVPAPGPNAPDAEALKYAELLVTLRRRDVKAAFAPGTPGARWLAWARHRFCVEGTTMVEGRDGRIDFERAKILEGQRTVILTIEQDLRAVEGTEPATPTTQVTEAP